MRVLGLDYGSRRTGVALGDTETRLASPWAVIESSDHAEVTRKVQELVAREKIDRVIVGIPNPLAGGDEENAQVKACRAFIERLRSAGLVVEEMDEMMTSKLAAAQMHERGEKGKRDDLAAAAILQSWLDVH